MSSIITREAALRLGLAARELGRVGVAAFAEAVGARLGLPLTETRLSTLTVSDLREILAGSHADEDCKVGVDAESVGKFSRSSRESTSRLGRPRSCQRWLSPIAAVATT